jgi:hypothetical protein
MILSTSSCVADTKCCSFIPSKDNNDEGIAFSFIAGKDNTDECITFSKPFSIASAVASNSCLS